MESFVITSSKYQIVEEFIAKQNKKAARLGCEPLVLTKVSEFLEEVIVDDRVNDISYRTYVSKTQFTIDGVAPKIPGFTIIGKIEHLDNSDQNLLYGFDGVALSEEKYRSVSCGCEHCGINRKRNSTYVVREEATGNEKQIALS